MFSGIRCEIYGLNMYAKSAWPRQWRPASIGGNLSSAFPDVAAEYPRWIEQHDTLRESDRRAIRTHLAALPLQPAISVVMAVGAENAGHGRASITSILNQLYTNWQLCLVHYGAQVDGLSRLLAELGGRDPRVRTVRMATLNGVDRATAWNTGIALSTADFVSFVHSGDRLSERALYEVAVGLAKTPQLDLLYSDEDCIDDAGQRSDVRFKPGWDPDLVLAENYVGGFAVYRRSLIDALGGFRVDFPGAEEHDLLLRAAELTTADCVQHVPSVLYHRRRADAGPGGEALAAVEALTAVVSSRRAVRAHLDARGDAGADVQPAALAPACSRVVWPLPRTAPMVSVIVPTRDRPELLQQCADGVLQRTDYAPLELLVVDNGSREPATQALFDRLRVSASDRVRIIPFPGPFNFAAMNNAAAEQARGDVLLLLNNDVHVIEPGWLREMVSQAVRPDVGAVGAKLLYPDERVQHGGVVLGPDGQITHLLRLSDRNDPGYGNQLALVRTLSAATAACLAIRKQVFMDVGRFDETNLPVAFNDIDLCLRLGDFGYRVVWTPHAELFHFESASRGGETNRPQFFRELQYMRRNWGRLLDDGDPFHNPNLRFDWGQTEIPSVPRCTGAWRSLHSRAGEVQ